MTQPPVVESPCVWDCLIDQSTGYCRGCFRTLEEISYWLRYTPAEQHRVMERIEARRAEKTSRDSAG